MTADLLAGLIGGSWSAPDRANIVNTAATVDDAQLLHRVAQRDREAFALLYDRYSGILNATIFRVLNNQEEAADVLQEVFVQIWNKAGAYDPKLGKPFNWALTLARNRAIDRLRSLKRRYSFIEEITQEMAGAAHDHAPWNDELLGHERAVAIRAAVESLPLEQRQAIEMAFLGGLTQNEISASLNQPLGTIKARIRRGMLKLRDTLRDVL